MIAEEELTAALQTYYAAPVREAPQAADRLRASFEKIWAGAGTQEQDGLAAAFAEAVLATVISLKKETKAADMKSLTQAAAQNAQTLERAAPGRLTQTHFSTVMRREAQIMGNMAATAQGTLPGDMTAQMEDTAQKLRVIAERSQSPDAPALAKPAYKKPQRFSL